MAFATLRSSPHNRAFHGLGLVVLAILMQRGDATQFKVGGPNGWTVPTDPNAHNQWAEGSRFQIGDSLLFAYLPDKDSVLQVNKDDYANCNTKSPIASFNDGYTSFMFYQSGTYYFISGNSDNCLKKEKLVVIVMADRSNRSSSTNTTVNASPPSPEINPSTPPPSDSSPPEMTPSTAPVGEETSNPPPPPPPNRASSSMVVSFMGSIGLLGSSLLLAL